MGSFPQQNRTICLASVDEVKPLYFETSNSGSERSYHPSVLRARKVSQKLSQSVRPVRDSVWARGRLETVADLISILRRNFLDGIGVGRAVQAHQCRPGVFGIGGLFGGFDPFGERNRTDVGAHTADGMDNFAMDMVPIDSRDQGTVDFDDVGADHREAVETRASDAEVVERNVEPEIAVVGAEGFGSGGIYDLVL